MDVWFLFGFWGFFDTSYVPCMLTKMKNVIHSHDTPPEKTDRDSFWIFSVSIQNALSNGWRRGQSPGGHAGQERAVVLDPVAKSAKHYTLDNSLPSTEISVQRHEKEN